MGDYLKRVLSRTPVAPAPEARSMASLRPSLLPAAEAQPADPFATPAIAPASPVASPIAAISPRGPAPVVTRGESIPTGSPAWTASRDFAPSPHPSSPTTPAPLSPPVRRDREGGVADTPEIVVEGVASSRDREPLAPRLTQPAIAPVPQPPSSDPLEVMERRMREVMSPHHVRTDERRAAPRDDVERTARPPNERAPEPVRLAPPRAPQESRTPRTPIGPQVMPPPPPAPAPAPPAPPRLVIGRLIVEVTPPARPPAAPPAAPQIIYAPAPRARAGGGGPSVFLRRLFGLGQS